MFVTREGDPQKYQAWFRLIIIHRTGLFRLQPLFYDSYFTGPISTMKFAGLGTSNGRDFMPYQYPEFEGLDQVSENTLTA
jgi:hypothetical protein